MKRDHLLNSTAILTCIRSSAFDPNKAGWKLDANGKIEMKDGNPIYIDSNGTESTIESGTIGRLNGEAKNFREAKERAENELKKFTGIDPEKARAALDTISKIDQKKLIDAGEVDKVRQEIGATYTTQLAEKDKAIETLQNKANNMLRTNAFATSKFIQERVAVPPEMFEATFGKNFKVENDKLVPYDNNGNQVYSAKRMGEVASLDEALEIIINGYPHKDAILKAPGASGSGNSGRGGGTGSGRLVTRDQFDKMAPQEQANVAAQARKGEAQIVD
jgi:hypothetical protein